MIDGSRAEEGLRAIHDQDMAVHRVGFAVIALSLTCVLLAVRSWQVGRPRIAAVFAALGVIIGVTGYVLTRMQTMV